MESLCRVSVPKTGDNNWDTYKVVSGKFSKPLQEGQQILHLQITGASCNIDKVVLKCNSEDGIEDVFMSPSQSGNLYNLSGQKVDANYRGVAIKNGRKMVIK